MKYTFDGSYVGLLTCVFDCYVYKEFDVTLSREQESVIDMFATTRAILSDIDKANRIKKALHERLGVTKSLDFYKAFLSEDLQTWQAIFYLMVRCFKGGDDMLSNYGNRDVMQLAQSLRKVSRERHRMKAFIRFQKSSDGLYFCLIEPDFNILPLIVNFFKNRYADQKWLIYDVKRKYGILYDLKSVSEIQLMEEERKSLARQEAQITLDESELKFQRLWQQYFKSTNIEARKNTKLHIQHVPKRYWKYLVEKKDFFKN